jgi:hypothetical protein
MNDIYGTVEKLHEGLADKTAKGTKSINNCDKPEFSPKKTVVLECCKKHDESLKLFQDSPAELYSSSCFFITCIVARVFPPAMCSSFQGKIIERGCCLLHYQAF